ncbi:hypothetical protein HRbin36_00593 [bacterium HR36]|nr:hypothetical protein HRbin36_00593 [bacterium HR36]
MFSASGLPDGLSLDTSTGLITGVLSHSLASRANPTREYTITLTASDGMESASTSATLTIRNVDYTLLSPGDQSNYEGDYVYLDLQSFWASDYSGLNMQAPLMFSAASGDVPNRLPPGLSIDPASGIISGTISSDAASPSNSPYSYYVVVTVQNLADGDTSTISFNWMIYEYVEETIDDTASGESACAIALVGDWADSLDASSGESAGVEGGSRDSGTATELQCACQATVDPPTSATVTWDDYQKVDNAPEGYKGYHALTAYYRAWEWENTRYTGKLITQGGVTTATIEARPINLKFTAVFNSKES